MNAKVAALVVPLAAALACAEHSTAPDVSLAERPMFQQRQGTGLVLTSITDLTLPLIGRLGDVVVDQAVITNFALVEGLAGAIVGLEAEGVLQLSGGVLGTDVVTEDFLTTVSVTSSGPGQCDLVSIDLGQIRIDALVAHVDVPAATLTGRGSGAVGTLLCTLGDLLGGLTGGSIIPGVGGIVNALNSRI